MTITDKISPTGGRASLLPTQIKMLFATAASRRLCAQLWTCARTGPPSRATVKIESIPPRSWFERNTEPHLPSPLEGEARKARCGSIIQVEHVDV